MGIRLLGERRSDSEVVHLHYRVMNEEEQR